MVPLGRYAMLVAADHLRHHLPVFARCSRKLVRHLCKPYWQAGWCNRDILHALDHRPSLFGQHPTQPGALLYSPTNPLAPAAFIRSRLAAWRTETGRIRPGHHTTRRHTTTPAARAATRAAIADRHGHAGARLLRAGETTLTPERITEHAHTQRTPHRAAPPPTTQPPTTQPTTQHSAPQRAAKLRATLLTQARAHQPAHATTTHTTPTPPTSTNNYQRALARARAERTTPAPRRSRRRSP